MSQYRPDQNPNSSTAIEYITSTDLLGVSGIEIRKLIVAYDQLEAEIRQCAPNFQFKYEVIAWLTASQTMLKSIQESNRAAAGIHSRIGKPHPSRPPIEHARHLTMNNLIMPVGDAIKFALTHEARYVVVHDNELDNQQARTSVETYLSSNASKHEHSPIIMVENSPYPNSVSKTRDVILRLQEHGHQVGFMVDFVHLCKELVGDIYSLTKQELDRVLHEMLAILHLIVVNFGIVGIHLPIGDNRDSLETNKIIHRFWFSMRQVLEGQSSLRFFTIENQQNGTEVFLSSKKLPAVAERNKRVLLPAVEAGLFTLNT
jgi:hypothetical protein